MDGDDELLADDVFIADDGMGELGIDLKVGAVGGRVEAIVASTKTEEFWTNFEGELGVDSI